MRCIQNFYFYSVCGIHILGQQSLVLNHQSHVIISITTSTLHFCVCIMNYNISSFTARVHDISEPFYHQFVLICV